MNLSRLLAYRRQIEDAMRIELAETARLLQEATERSAAYEEEVSVKQWRYIEAGRGGLTVDEAHQWYADIEAASWKVARAGEAHDTLRREWSNKQADLIDAMQQRKKLDILVRRRMEARQREQLHDDQRLMDEQAARRRGTRDSRGRTDQGGTDSHG
ncbi:MAG TPA: flagellar FliJ family protein [Nitrospiraceae bacterium]|nr:flagellar FliJ family protein [Nitrospiraceae bacterium]